MNHLGGPDLMVARSLAVKWDKKEKNAIQWFTTAGIEDKQRATVASCCLFIDKLVE